MLLIPGFPYLHSSDRLSRAAGERPSWYIAPIRTGNINDLITGSNIVTFTNSSPAWGFNSSGVLVQPSANVPFIEYDPATGSALGWRIWDAVTNLLVRSEEFTVSPWAPFGTASRSANVTTAPNGTLTADSVTLPIGSGIYQSTSASANTAYNFSIWLRADSAQTVRLVINTNLSDPTLLTVNVTTQWQRFSITKTTATGTTGLSAQLDTGNGGTFYVWGAQLAVGATLAPYVPTGALTASSTADVASITGAAFAGIWNNTEATIFCKFFSDNTAGSGRTSLLFDVGAGGAFGTTGYGAFESSLWSINPSFAPMNLFSTVSVSAGTKAIGTMAARFKANDSRIAVNGTLGTLDSACAVPASPTTLYIGRSGWSGSANYANGYIQEFATLKSGRPDPNLTAMAAS
jgi:hypothetical protein